MRRGRWILPVAVLLALAGTAVPATASHNPDEHSDNMRLRFTSPNERPFLAAGRGINSDMAFWGTRLYQGDYGGFRIFDISNPFSPKLLSSFDCDGPQNDPVVWQNRILLLAVDQTMASPECGSARVPSTTPDAWEGVRIFDVSNPRRPRQVGALYLDCGAHTITPYGQVGNELIVYASSYPLRPGPTCGEFAGIPPGVSGRDPLHGVIQVFAVPLNNPAGAYEVAEPPITYPGDPDGRFVWSEHGIPFIPGALEFAARACHDIAVFRELNLAAGACNEQLQLWNIDPGTGIPDTANPVWVFDDEEDETGITGDPADPGVVVDFWHSAAFSWDGEVVVGIDESFGAGCPPTTPVSHHPGDTGRMFFFDAATGTKLSHFMIDRAVETDYCSAHLGNVVHTRDGYFAANAWYLGGADIVDFTDPTDPQEVAFYDIAPAGATGGDNWSAYWYAPPRKGASLAIFTTDGVHNPATGRGLAVFEVTGLGIQDIPLGQMNPQSQERLLR